MIDWTRAGELRSEIGDDGFAEVVELFLDEVEDVVMRLRATPDPANYERDENGSAKVGHGSGVIISLRAA